MEAFDTDVYEKDDLLLHVENVICRKVGEGVLSVMKDRLVWQSRINGTNIVLKYEDVRAQKISPANKPKVQLQICLLSDASTTFQFVNPVGIEGQLRDRESVKELLQQLLPLFRKKLHPELEQKQKVLQNNKTLLALYKELVISKVMSTEDFWNYFGAEELSNQTKTEVQKVGVSAGFVNDLTTADACNEVKFSITSDIMASIFGIYPVVKQKHDDLVPSQMTEEQFWTQFFNSHYFHRDRLNNLNPKEVFVDCLRIENEDLENQLRRFASSAQGERLVPQEDLQESPEKTEAEDEDGKNGHKSTSLICRLNYHSTRIVRTNCEHVDLPEEEATLSEQPLEGATSGPKLSASAGDSCSTAQVLHLPSPSALPLLRASSSPSSASRRYSKEDRQNLFALVNRSKPFWSSSETGVALLDDNPELSAMMILNANDELFVDEEPDLNDITKADIAKNLSQLQFLACQLLHRFWSCYPPTTAETEGQLVAMEAALKRFDATKIQAFQDQFNTADVPCEINYLGAIRASLNIAYAKYDQWVKKRSRNNGT